MKRILLFLFFIMMLSSVNANMSVESNITINHSNIISEIINISEYDYSFYSDTYNIEVVDNYILYWFTFEYYNATEWYENDVLVKINKNNLNDYNYIYNSTNYIHTIMNDDNNIYIIYRNMNNFSDKTISKYDINLNLIKSNSIPYLYSTNSNGWFYFNNYIYFQSYQHSYYYAKINKLNTTSLNIESDITVQTAWNYYSEPMGSYYYNDGIDDYGFFYVGSLTGGINKILLSNMSLVSNYLVPPFHTGGSPTQYRYAEKGFFKNNSFYLPQLNALNYLGIVNSSNISDINYISTYTNWIVYTDYNQEYLYHHYRIIHDYLYLKQYYFNGTLKQTLNLYLDEDLYYNIDSIKYDNNNKLYLIYKSFDKEKIVIYKVSLEDIPLSLDISGTIKFKDVDDNIYNLNNSLIYYNDSVFTYTDSSGNFIINGLDNNKEYKLTISYNQAMNTDICIVNVNNTVCEITLLYSKPFLSKPVKKDNFFITEYLHNFKTISLWENPNFVWGNYTYNNNSYIKSCEFVSSNKFRCSTVLSKNYMFSFIYSDYFNTNLNGFHPFLTGSRNFNTDNIYITNGIIIDNNTGLPTKTEKPIKISELNQLERENITYSNFLSALFFMIILIIIIAIISFGDKLK